MPSDPLPLSPDEIADIRATHLVPHGCMGIDPIMGRGRRAFGLDHDGVQCDAARLLATLDREQEARALARTEWATWLLDIDYGVDFSTPGNRAPVDVLEEMVRIADADPKYQFGGEAYYVLSAELGDWRAESDEAAALSRLGERE